MNKEKKQYQWLVNYERRRNDPDHTFKIPPFWHSTKFPLEEMSWSEIRELPVPELGCTFGEACQRLKRAWSKYKRFHKQGDRAFDWILKVNRIQRALGVEMTDFRDGPGLDWVKDQLDLEDQGTGVELSGEELELKFEEDQAEKENWSTWEEEQEESVGTLSEPEDPLYTQLRLEEKEQAEEQEKEEYGVWNEYIEDD